MYAQYTGVFSETAGNFYSHKLFSLKGIKRALGLPYSGLQL
jgi:hypothetical protein